MARPSAGQLQAGKMNPGHSEIVVETEKAIAEYLPVARRLFGFSEDWNVGPTRFTWKGYSSRCRYIDGRHCLWFDFDYLLSEKGVSIAHEYGIYRNDITIGQISTSDWRIHVRQTVAHELAHAVQCSLPLVNTSLHLGRQYYQGLGVFHTGHGPFFQEIYAWFRDELINHLVPASSIGVPGARTRIRKQPDLNEVPHPLIGSVIHHPKHGKLEAVMVKQSEVYAIGGPRDDFTPIPVGRFMQLCGSKN